MTANKIGFSSSRGNRKASRGNRIPPMATPEPEAKAQIMPALNEFGSLGALGFRSGLRRSPRPEEMPCGPAMSLRSGAAGGCCERVLPYRTRRLESGVASATCCRPGLDSLADPSPPPC